MSDKKIYPVKEWKDFHNSGTAAAMLLCLEKFCGKTGIKKTVADNIDCEITATVNSQDRIADQFQNG